MSGFDLTGPIVLLGTLTGLGYALLAVGLVLTYRSSRVINFAHGAVGLFVAGLFAVVVGRYDVPYLLGFPAALLCGALVGAGVEALIVRRLAAAPRVLVMVATLGIGEALLLLSLSFNSGGLGGRTFPQPTLFPAFEVGPLFIPPSLTALLILTPVLLVALGLFLERSRYGVAMRGAASNPDAATLAGAAPQNMSMLAWALAGLVATFSALLVLPSRSAVTPESLGPGFLLRGLAAAALARFANLPVAFAAGVGLGILEAVLASNPSATGSFEVAVFVIVLIGVGVQSRARRGRVAEDRWADLAPAPGLPEVYRRLRLIRWAPPALGALCVLVAALLPAWINNQQAFVLAVVLGFAVVAMSVSLLTGIGGQLSLGQVAFGAIGALAAVAVLRETGSLIVALLCGAVAGGLAAGVVGLPALRVRGQLLGVATLAFTLMASGWLLRQEWAFDRTGVSAPPRQVLGIELTTSRAYYYVAVVAFAVALAGATLARRSRFGQRLRAVRDNEDAARALRTRVSLVKLGSYVVAGMLAGLGGSVIGFASTQISAALFTPRGSVDAVSIAVIGGLGGFVGPLLGSLYLVGIPRLFDLGLTPLAALNAGWLILILEQPRGLSALLGRVRDGYHGAVARLAGLPWSVAGEPAPAPAQAPDSRPARPVASPPPDRRDLLVVDGLSKRFGGTRAVDGVSFSVASGDRLGIIGPNGAGKTTLFELISGFVAPDAGTVHFDGVNVSAHPPERRSRAGLVRSFQNARLFPTMTVAETVALAASANPARPDPEEFLDAFGLGPRAAQPLSAMPTGTRRLVELAAGLALHPRVLLLDEPSAGIAQSETPELASVLERISRTYGVTLVIIEHDVPLLAEVCNRMLALEVGAVIAQGTPAEVTTHPDVIRSYLGERHTRRGSASGTGD